MEGALGGETMQRPLSPPPPPHPSLPVHGITLLSQYVSQTMSIQQTAQTRTLSKVWRKITANKQLESDRRRHGLDKERQQRWRIKRCGIEVEPRLSLSMVGTRILAHQG